MGLAWVRSGYVPSNRHSQPSSHGEFGVEDVVRNGWDGALGRCKCAVSHAIHLGLLWSILVFRLESLDMKLIKTDKGREALRSRDPHLAPRERQIVILANGAHSRVSLQELMARDIGPELHRLLQSGYLEERLDTSHSAHRAAQSSSVFATAATGLYPLAAQPMTGVPTQQQLSRRSLAGTKMYIVDMLQLLRDMDASAMAVSVHSSQGEMEFIQNVVAATRLIVEKCGPSYGLRVANKLREIVPEVHLIVLHTLASDIEALVATP